MRSLSAVTVALALLVALAGCAGLPGEAGIDDPAPPEADLRYLDPDLPAEDRATILLGRMTLEDKVGQMTLVARDFLASLDDIRYYRLGAVLSGGGSAPTPNTVPAWREMTDSMQRKALETPLAIPILYGTDAVHGHGNLEDSVVFPHHIGLGAANNPELVEEVARITALEMVATGARWNFSPCLAVPQDIRWGRTYEGFSSDPAIVSTLGRAETIGLQSGWGSAGSVLACAKHFLGDGGTRGGVDRGDTTVDDQELRTTHLYPYLASFEAGVGSVMASFSSVNGEPMHSSGELMTDLLKAELAFDGFVVSDWGAVDMLPGSSQEQVAIAINAGIDMVMVPEDYIRFIRDLKSVVRNGHVSMERIDDAVLRILTVKIRMGLFESPFADPDLESLVGSAGHRETARRAVAESQVLLKNTGVLPLGTTGRILVYGEFADDVGAQSGGWTLAWQGELGNRNEGTTIVEAIVAEVGEQRVRHVRTPQELAGITVDEFDTVVLVTGEPPYAEMEGDNQRPSVRAEDLEVAAAFNAAGVPLVSIILSGRPLILDGLDVSSDALVAAWLPGTEGSGISDVLFARVPFKGTLPFAWPADERGLTQGADSESHLYPRGYGLRE